MVLGQLGGELVELGPQPCGGGPTEPLDIWEGGSIRGGDQTLKGRWVSGVRTLLGFVGSGCATALDICGEEGGIEEGIKGYRYSSLRFTSLPWVPLFVGAPRLAIPGPSKSDSAPLWAGRDSPLSLAALAQAKRLTCPLRQRS